MTLTMKRAAIPMIAAMLPAVLTTPVAAGSLVSSAPSCEGATPVSEATCISGEITSTTDSLGNTTYSAWAESSCSAYATIKADIVMKGGTRQHFVLDDAARVEITSTDEIRAVNCCWDDGKICYKDQVEADESGYITRRGNTRTSAYSAPVNVSTNWDRWTYCQWHTTDIYCQVDPQGDAWVQPAVVVPEGSTVQDCLDKHATSPAATSTADDRCTGVELLVPSWQGHPLVPLELRTLDKYVLENEQCTVFGLNDCIIDGETWDAADAIGMLNPENPGGIYLALVNVPVDDMDDMNMCEVTNMWGLKLWRGHAGTCPDTD